MPQIRLRPFMAPDNGDFRRFRQVQSLPALQKCHARRRNRGPAQIAIAGAGEIMKLNREVGRGRPRTYLTNSQRVRRSFRGRGTLQQEKRAMRVLLAVGAVVGAIAFAVPAQTETRVFIVASNSDGYGVDRCLSTGASCGSAVATAYCQARDFSQARSFRKVDHDEITGSGAKNQACGIGCDELVAIECTR
jgi:hypothetical protein